MLPDDIGDMVSLQLLMLQETRVKDFPSSINKLASLTNLSISFLNLHKIPDDVVGDLRFKYKSLRPKNPKGTNKQRRRAKLSGGAGLTTRRSGGASTHGGTTRRSKKSGKTGSDSDSDESLIQLSDEESEGERKARKRAENIEKGRKILAKQKAKEAEEAEENWDESDDSDTATSEDGGDTDDDRPEWRRKLDERRGFDYASVKAERDAADPDKQEELRVLKMSDFEALRLSRLRHLSMSWNKFHKLHDGFGGVS